LRRQSETAAPSFKLRQYQKRSVLAGESGESYHGLLA
jgi:hypothetical protein